ncbi:MAG: lysoplasmalogenase family protein, partial [Desulfobacterales bacterium]
MNILIVVFAAGLLIGLLYCEKKEAPKARLAVKSLLSSLFIFAAVVQIHPIPLYYRFLLIGMIFCLGGDVFLALPAPKMFLFGLISFLLGHVFYAAAFFYSAGFNQWAGIGLAISALAGAAVFLWLRSHLGAMKIPVIFYILVISVMVVGAW